MSQLVFAHNDTLTETVQDTPSTDKKKNSEELTDTVSYESNYINYDAEGKILYLVGSAVIKYQNITLLADTIIYTINNDLFTASGSPRLIEGTDTTIGDFMAYNIKTRRGRVQYASTHFNQGYFNGQSIIKTDKDELYVDQGDYTTCAVVDTPHFYFYGRKIKVIPNDKIMGKPVVLNIGDAPVAVLPYFVFPINQKRRNGFLTPGIGGNFNNGGYIENIGYYFAPNDYVDFKLSSRIAEFSDFLFEGSSRYSKKYLLNGNLSARYQYKRNVLANNQQWALIYNHNQNITPDGLTTLSGQGTLTSAKDFFKETSDDTTELLNQNLTANLSLNRRFEKLNASASITLSRSHNLQTDHITGDLPSVNFNLQSRPIIPLPKDIPQDSARWYNTIFYSYNLNGNVHHSKDSSGDTLNPYLNQYFRINTTQKLFKYINISPSISGQIATTYGYRDTTVIGDTIIYDTISYILVEPFKDNRYSDIDYPVVKIDTLSRNQQGTPDTLKITRVRTIQQPLKKPYEYSFKNDATWQADLSLSTNLYGLFPIKIFRFAGLHHTFSPSITYTFIPKHNQPYEFINGGIPGREKNQQLMSFNLSNQLDGKILKPKKDGEEKPEELKFPILNFNLSSSYDFEKESRKWNDLSLSASTGIKGLRVTYSSNFWLYDINDKLSAPIMRDLNLSLSTGSLSASGKFWNGDLLELDSLRESTTPAADANNRWQVSLSPSFTYSLRRNSPTEIFTPEKHYNLSGSASLFFSKNWSIQWNGSYNFNEDQWVHNVLSFRCDLECWDMSFDWRPEKLNPGYYFKINIKKIPEIKWEQKG
ncbi:MAG: hypothetical protein GX640_06855 [Fibrobacter sp.]|nr:hypothetical protein [Fibrobacter sp.]